MMQGCTCMMRFLISVFLLALCFFMPIQIYIIGDGIGAGVQGAFYRYQESSYGSSFITVNQELQYVLSGSYSGRTALSVLVWIVGDVVLVIATILALIQNQDPQKRTSKIIYLSLISGAILFFISIVLQYGILLKSTAGVAIPVGTPLILVFGYYFYKL
jgi:hypothetical protein